MQFLRCPGDEGIFVSTHACQSLSDFAQAGFIDRTRMISTSKIKISVTVEEDQIEEAARVVHTAFGLDATE